MRGRALNTCDICHVLVIIDGTTEEVLEVVELERFDKQKFIEQLDVPALTDPDMLDRYVIGPDDVTFISGFLSKKIDFNFSAKGYWIEAVKHDA